MDIQLPDPLTKYNARLEKRRISTWDPPQDLPGPKFYPNGDARPYYGVTCIAWVEQGSELFRKLHDAQQTIKEELDLAGFGGMYTFLEPETFHMTVCDIDATPDPAQIRRADRMEQVRKAFEQVEPAGKVTCLIKGIGLKQTIAALVRFDRDPTELDAVLALERRIKRATGEDMRAFTGHVSLAYLVRHPGDDTGRLKETLLPYEGQDFGEFAFSRFDLTHFADMNTYTPLLTIGLEDGAVTLHDRSGERLSGPGHAP